MEVFGNEVIHRHILNCLDQKSTFKLRLVNKRLNNMHYLNVVELHLNYVKLSVLKRYKNLNNLSCPKTQVINRIVESFPSSLRKLDISSCNRLNGNLDLSKFIHLEHFSCRNTRLTNQALNGLTFTLKELNIEYCHCFDRHLDLTKFFGLEKLCITSCSQIDLSQMNLSKLVNLKEIHCSISNTRDQKVEIFPACLETLKLDGNNQRADSNALDFSVYNRLKVFICYHVCFQDGLSKRLPFSLERMSLECCKGVSDLNVSKFVNLKYLLCSNMSIENISINTLPLFLETLVLSNSEIIHAHSFNLKEFTNLKVLDCSATNIRTVSIDTIPLSVEELSLRNCKIIIVDTFDLSKHVMLKKLDCSGIKNFTKMVVSKLPLSLEKLDICGCSRLGNIALSRLSKLTAIKCSGLNIGQITSSTFPALLELLSLQGCGGLSVYKFNLTAYGFLEDLDCSYTNLTDEMISRFPTSLRKLDISGCEKLQNIILSKYCSIKIIKCSNLNIQKVTLSTFPLSIEMLDLEGCKYLEANDFDLSAFNNLNDLNISDTDLTDDAMEKLPISLRKLDIVQCANLKKFNLSGCKNLEELNYTSNCLTDWALAHFPPSLIKIHDYGDTNHRSHWPRVKNPPYVNFYI